MSGFEMFVGQTFVFQIFIGEMSAGQKLVGRTSVFHLFIGQLPVDKKHVCQLFSFWPSLSAKTLLV
jgi:hypothetical protein